MPKLFRLLGAMVVFVHETIGPDDTICRKSFKVENFCGSAKTDLFGKNLWLQL